MFWGVTLENGKRYSQVVDIPVHISMASLDPSTESSSNSSKAVSVMIDHEKSEFVLCTLIPGKKFQQPLDLQFAEGEEVTLFLNGQGIVHLTGYADDSEPGIGGEDTDDSEDDLTELTDEQIEALIRARNQQAEVKSLKRKAIEGLPKDSKNKQLKRDSRDEEEDDDDDDSDEDDDDEEGDSDDDDDLDDEDEGDDGSEGDSEEEDSDDEGLYVTTASKGSGDSQTTPGKRGMSTPAKQQQNQQKQTPKKTPKVPGQIQKGQPGQTPFGHSGKTQKGQAGQASKRSPGQQQQQQQKNSPKTPAVNGNDSLNETESAKKRNRRQRKKKNSLDSPTSNATPAKPGSDSKPAAKASEGTPSKGGEQQKLSGGVIVEDLKKGNGPIAKSGKFVQVFYTGRLANGKEFDSTGDGKPFKFRLGSNEVIKGWDIGLQGMKVGGTRKITIPPSQGYGSKSIGKIPSNSTLVFDVRLAAVN